MQEVLKVISENNLETVVIALMVNVLTAIIKIPIKKLSLKSAIKKYTGYIVFIPIVTAFILSVTYGYLKTGLINVNDYVISLWLSSASLSLAVYAIIEKVIAKNYVYMSEEEISITNEYIEKLKALFLKENKTNNSATENNDEKNIILKSGE